jgi:hypothetical protein
MVAVKDFQKGRHIDNVYCLETRKTTDVWNIFIFKLTFEIQVAYYVWPIKFGLNMVLISASDNYYPNTETTFRNKHCREP